MPGKLPQPACLYGSTARSVRARESRIGVPADAATVLNKPTNRPALNVGRQTYTKRCTPLATACGGLQ
eukprot:8123993-Alexandrium_andersonii.AAC.1